MPSLYRYKARDKKGAEITGEISGETPEAVSTHLESLNLLPIKISSKASGFSLSSPFGRKKVGHEDLIVITRNLATLYRAGIPLLRSLDIIAEQYADSPIGATLQAVRTDVERGEQLSEALIKYPHVFSPIFVASVRAAEISGKLNQYHPAVLFGNSCQQLKSSVAAAVIDKNNFPGKADRIQNI